MKDSKVINRKRAKREQRGLISEFAFEREQQRQLVLSYETSDEDAWFWDETGFGMVHGELAALAGRPDPRHDRVSRSAARSSEPIRGTIERADPRHDRANRPATRPCSPGELARVTANLAGESTSITAVLSGRAGSCHGRARRRVDRQHGRARLSSLFVLGPPYILLLRRNIGVVSTDPKTELRKLRMKMHGYGMGPGSEWSTENWPLSLGEPIRGTIELAGELARVTAELAGESTGNTAVLAGDSTGNTVVLALARRASWLVSRPSSPGDPFRLFIFSTFEVLTEILFF
ncbi:hypothetical protein F2Q69_00043104 [Brassica cretica]|uniref:Uncharacterized protein n=1 Tax=Brassica cretica TaxID=69181 RepID=A0A8S9NHU4_BRACR|nr:hypothetical protein F2Q69_00043104 [Brassica cretica]